MVCIDKKSLEASRNNHHVWASYMRRWSLDNKQVFYTTKKSKKIAFDSVKNIAVERDFYRIQTLSNQHVELIKGLSMNSPEDLSKQHMSYLEDFLILQKLESMYQQQKKKDKTAEKMLEAMKSNSIERLHSAHENEAKNAISELANGSLAILDSNKEMCFFMQFLAHQFTRTKTFKDNALLGFAEGRLAEENGHFFRMLKESWWFISYMFGMNIGRSLFLSRHSDSHCLLVNDTNVPFITSDQPVVNVHPALGDAIRSPDEHECDFYYPISPRFAYMINKSDRFPRGKSQVTTETVDKMNVEIAKKANVHIIGLNEESLKPYKKLVGLNRGFIESSLSKMV